MELEFRQIERKDFSDVRNLALKGWYFAYSHIKKESLKKLVDKYYSHESLERAIKYIEEGAEFFVLAFEKEKLIGFCHVGLKENGDGEIYRLYIEPELIGKGLGKKLLVLGENFLKSKGCKKLSAFANKHNKAGLDFYFRNGFKHIPEKDQEDEFEKEALMFIEKSLK